MPLLYTGGVVLQCLALLRARPRKWAVVTFLGMILYMGVLMGYAVLDHSSRTSEPAVNAFMPLVISFGFVIAFLFVASFLREVSRVISEAVVVSITISYWFLVLERAASMNIVILVCALVAGIPATVGALRLVAGREILPARYKLVHYAWFLFVNVLFVVEYYDSLPTGFPLARGSADPGVETLIRVGVLGMVNVHLVFNGGILYYSSIYSLLYRDARREVIERAGQLFTDRQVTMRSVMRMLLAQGAVFAAMFALPSWIRFYILSFWILLTPVVDLVLRRFRSDWRYDGVQ